MFRKKNVSKNYDLSRLLFFISVCLIFAIVLYFVPRISAPLILAYIFSLVIRPVFPWFYRFGIKEKISLFILVMIGWCIFLIPLVNVFPRLKTEALRVQAYWPEAENFMRLKIIGLQTQINQNYGVEISTAGIDVAINKVKEKGNEFLLELPKLLTSFFEWLFLIPLFLYFFITEGGRFKKAFLVIIPNRYFEKIYFLAHQFDKRIGGYIFAKFVEANLVGFIIGIGLATLGFPFAILLGFLAGLTNIIPYLGPLLGLIPAILVIMIDAQYTSFMGPVLALYIIANIFDMVVIFPLLVARIVNLHPILVVVSVILGSHFWGVIGMVVSVPMANVAQLIFNEIYRDLYPIRLKEEE